MIGETFNSDTKSKNQTYLDTLIFMAKMIAPLFAISAIAVYLVFVWVSFDPDILWRSGDKGGAIRFFYLLLTVGLTVLLQAGIELFRLSQKED